MKRVRGVSLVEVLAAMTVLVIGVTAVTLMLLQGTKFTRAAIERNAAAMILAEAVPEIERRHLITERMSRIGVPDLTLNDPLPENAILPEELGLLIETLDSTPNPNIHDDRYGKVRTSNSNTQHLDALSLKCVEGMAPAEIHMSMWPMPIGKVGEPPRMYGSLQNSLLRNRDESPHGTPLRVLYRLERHQDWHPHQIDASGVATYGAEIPNSAYRGVYVLTMTIYRDSRHDASALEQVSDPYVVHLYDRKVRVAP